MERLQEKRRKTGNTVRKDKIVLKQRMFSPTSSARIKSLALVVIDILTEDEKHNEALSALEKQSP